MAVHTAGLGDVALCWRAIWEVGAGAAALDGVSSLQAAGLRGFDERALRAASWAVSDRQAALVPALVVQQRVVTAGMLLTAASAVPVRRRRALIPLLAADIAAGAQSLGELDFAALCRRHGLPTPDRQVVRTTPAGRSYLDVCWSDVGLVVEIDGSGHRFGLAVMDDNLRQNTVVLGGETVLWIDLVGLRLRADVFLAQVPGPRPPHPWSSRVTRGPVITPGVVSEARNGARLTPFPGV